MATNEEILAKAAITTDAIATAGKLSPAQADKFIDYVIEEAKLASLARIVRMQKGESWEIDKIGIGRRAAVPAPEARDPGVRRGITTSKVTITPREIVVPFEIGDQFKRQNIQGDDVEDLVVRMMARQTANDLEELYLNGDALGAGVLESDYMESGSATLYRKDSYLALFNGFLRLADSGNVVDAAGVNIAASHFGSAIRAMPTKFRRNRAELRWLMPADVMELWREKVASRATAVGDAALSGSGDVKPFGIMPVEVPLFPFQPTIVEHIVLNGLVATSLRYAPVSNVVVTPSTLDVIPTAAYSGVTDYAANLVNGTIARVGGTTIGDGATVKVTYDAQPQILLTALNNLIVAIAREVTIEKDRDIYRAVNQYAIRATIGCGIEESTALVKVKNIGLGV
jgi:hypothetical protein